MPARERQIAYTVLDIGGTIMITHAEKKQIRSEVDEWLINFLMQYDAEYLEEVTDIIRNEVEDMLVHMKLLSEFQESQRNK
jgi:hypothetical protein